MTPFELFVCVVHPRLNLHHLAIHTQKFLIETPRTSQKQKATTKN